MRKSMKRMNKSAILILVSFLSILTHAQSNVIDEVVWVVGDEAILRSDVEQTRNQYGQTFNGNPYCMIPEQLAIQKLFLHQAVIDSVEVTDAEVNRYVEQDLNDKVLMAGSKEKLEEYMRMPMGQIREELFDGYKNKLTANKMREQITKDVKVTPAEVRRYFKDLPEDSLPLIPTQVEVQILVQNPKIPQTEIDRVKAVLRDYAERATTGNTSFATLARLYSQDEGCRRQGGEMPYMGRGELDPAFANVAFSLTDPNKVSKVVQSEFGYHIIQLIDKRGDKVKVRHILLRPNVAQDDINACLARLDSISEDIRKGEFTFEDGATAISEDKDTRNNHGILSNNTDEGDHTTRFEMGQLASVSPEIARVVEGLETGEISKPFTMVNTKGATVCAIAKLKSRIKAHRASMSEDFQVLKGLVEEKKKDELVEDWIRKKQKNTYVRINEDWRDCDFQYPGWIKE